MTIRSIPNFFTMDPVDLGYPMSFERKMRAMMGQSDPWELPKHGPEPKTISMTQGRRGATLADQAEAQRDGAE